MKPNRSSQPRTKQTDSQILIELEELDHIDNFIQQTELRLIETHFADFLQQLLQKGSK